MNGVTIFEQDESSFALSFGVKEIMDSIGAECRSYTWELRAIDAQGEGADRLHEFDDVRNIISGDVLYESVSCDVQVIDGKFIARIKGDEESCVIIEAVDGSMFDVFSCEKNLERIRHAFKNVEPYPSR